MLLLPSMCLTTMLTNEIFATVVIRLHSQSRLGGFDTARAIEILGMPL